MVTPEKISDSRISEEEEPKFLASFLVLHSLTVLIGFAYWVQHRVSPFVSMIISLPLICFIYVWCETFIDSCKTSRRYKNLSRPLILIRNQKYIANTVINPQIHLCSVADAQKRSSFRKIWPYDELDKVNMRSYFVGYLDLEGVKELLHVDGEFVIGVQGEMNLEALLWVFWDKLVRRLPVIRIRNDRAKTYCIEGNRQFPDVGTLVKWYGDQMETLFVNLQNVKASIKLASIKIWHPNRTWYLTCDTLTVKGMLSAHKSIFRGQMNLCNEVIDVTIKCPREGTFKAVTEHLLKEGRLARHLIHPNVVKFYGTAVDSYRIMLAMECGEIDLQKCVKQVDLPLMLKLKFAQEIAMGMSHVASKRILHNDLCLLNCVIFKDPKYGLIAKVIDFDLALDMDENKSFTNLKVLPRIPAQYMSPEALSGFGSEKSDVWQYGLMLWELFSDGAVPYDNYRDESFMNVILEHGCILRNVNVPHNIGQLIKDCLNRKVSIRPTFDDITSKLSFIMCDLNYVCNEIEFDTRNSVILYAFNTSQKLLQLAIRFADRTISDGNQIDTKFPELAIRLRNYTEKTWLCFTGDSFSISYILFYFYVIYFKIANTKVLLISLN